MSIDENVVPAAKTYRTKAARVLSSDHGSACKRPSVSNARTNGERRAGIVGRFLLLTGIIRSRCFNLPAHLLHQSAIHRCLPASVTDNTGIRIIRKIYKYFSARWLPVKLSFKCIRSRPVFIYRNNTGARANINFRSDTAIRCTTISRITTRSRNGDSLQRCHFCR